MNIPHHGFRMPRSAMTVVELLVVYIVLGLLLVLIAGVGGYIQTQAKISLANDMVLTLREAVVVYHASEGHYPPDAEDYDSTPALEVLLGNEAARAVLASWPIDLPEQVVKAHFRDPWGRPFRYITRDAGVAAYRERVELDGGVPIFASAGPDGQFGAENESFSEDNIASDNAMMLMGPVEIENAE